MTERNAALPATDGSTDPHLWLEEVTGEEALAWVRERNTRAEGELDADGEVTALATELKQILDSPASIPHVRRRGDHLYNFWTDAEHPRGLWRRTTPDSFRTDDPEWEILIDVDALNTAEKSKAKRLLIYFSNTKTLFIKMETINSPIPEITRINALPRPMPIPIKSENKFVKLLL